MNNVPKGHVNCYFSSKNRCITPSFNYAKELALAKVVGGWKVGIEQDPQTKEYIVYWGA